MRFLAQFVSAVAALAAGISVGHVAVSLDAPSPWPLLAAIATALLAIYVLDTLTSTLQAHRAARRG